MFTIPQNAQICYRPSTTHQYSVNMPRSSKQ